MRLPRLYLVMLAISSLHLGLAPGAGAVSYDLHTNAAGMAEQFNASSSDADNREIPRPVGAQDVSCSLIVCWGLQETAATDRAASGNVLRWAFGNTDSRFDLSLLPPEQPPRFPG